MRKVERTGRIRWEVRWHEGSRHRSRLFDRRSDAQAFEADLRRRRQLGPLAVRQLTRTAPSLGEWIIERWGPEHAATLELSTRRRYANVYECHIAGRLGETPLNEITVGRLREWQVALISAGVKPGTVQKARTLLSSVLRHAAEAEAIPGNPLSLVRSPKAAQRDRVRPLVPAHVEAIRRQLLQPVSTQVAASKPGQRSRRAYPAAPRSPQQRQRDALIVSVLAYAGLRPGELSALRWQDVGERSLLIQRATAPDGTVKTTKNAQARSVQLLAPLAAELREWRLAAGRPAQDALVVATSAGTPWSKEDWGNWRDRRWAPACRAAGYDTAPRPYDLRHSFASLLLAEGRQPVYVAEQLGHSVAVLLERYAHLLPEFEGRRVEPEREISSAREISCTSGVRRAAV